MTDVSISRCIGPTVTSRTISTYTIAGFTGYLAANALAVVLARTWQLSLGERLVACLAPPLAFIVVVTIASAIAKRERIVFYQATGAAFAAVGLIGWIAGLRVERLLDVTAVGIGTFLVFGRLGCLSVACCHGTLGRGVVYGPRHVAVGFWARWSGRALWPVQGAEAAASAGLVIAALWLERGPGDALLIYTTGYAAVRFTLEFLRGDTTRAYALGLSEAQWIALATAVLAAIWRPGMWTAGSALGLAVAAAIAVARRRHRELVLPPHLGELDRVMRAVGDGERRETSLGLAVSRHDLPDGRTDWILSAVHPRWGEALLHRLARLMWPAYESLPGHTPGVFHVIARSR